MVAAAALSPAAVSSQNNEYGNPVKRAPQPTVAEISANDLRTRLYIFADDSMQGRQAGRIGNQKGTAYIARELRRLGVEPAGDNGTYFQELPAVVRKYTAKSTLTVNGKQLRWLTDFVAVPGAGAPGPMTNVQVIYGGIANDTTTLISAEQAAGKLVVLSPPAPGQGRAGRGGGRGGRGGAFAGNDRLLEAAGVAIVDLHTLSTTARALINDPPAAILYSRTGAAPQQPARVMAPTFRITPEAAAQLLGKPLVGLAPGASGGTASAQLDFVEQPAGAYVRNVVGVIRGSDPTLRNQYVAVGSHNDHVGFTGNPVEHDSARAAASTALAMRMVDGELRNLSPEERAAIRVNVDSLRRIRPARRDSINNGADDDGSGSMAMLEIAEAIARASTKPARSVLLVWHTAEERGLLGSAYFVERPTVPRDSIVAQINMDMIGRGRATDIPGGGEDYLAVVGSKILSPELGELVAAVNQKQPRPLKLDYRFDDSISWQGYNNIYGRSDHANYARHNIPIAFFFTGLHQDYHQVTDEPQYIDYPHYTRVTQYVHDLVREVAN
ncbi:MAG TPA: M28 family peptidase, partial [Longimicrobiales bacterium]|nr:M28 family peptidase [Longimicrobiales bacterium]